MHNPGSSCVFFSLSRFSRPKHLFSCVSKNLQPPTWFPHSLPSGCRSPSVYFSVGAGGFFRKRAWFGQAFPQGFQIRRADDRGRLMTEGGCCSKSANNLVDFFSSHLKSLSILSFQTALLHPINWWKPGLVTRWEMVSLHTKTWLRHSECSLPPGQPRPEALQRLLQMSLC